MKKVLHFTHIDSDALGCDVLIKYFYEYFLGNYEVETYYIANSNVDRFITDTMSKYTTDIVMNSNPTSVYDAIYITDIGPTIETVGSVMEYKNMAKKVLNRRCDVYEFDHHVTNNIADYYDEFVVANNLYALYNYKYRDRLERFVKPDNFSSQYYILPWMHDNTDVIYESIDDVRPTKSMSISATLLVFLHVMSLMWVFDQEIDRRNITYNRVCNCTLGYLAKDISCYDTWEWKTNKYLNSLGREDRASKLVDMLGIETATAVVLENVTRLSKIGIKSSTEYIPEKYSAMYEYDKFKSFNYIKHSYNNVRVLKNMHIKGFFNTLGVPDLYDDKLESVFLSISDNTVDLGEQSTFITSYFTDCRCMFVHIFVSSRSVSFRSCLKHGVNVSAIAKELGGGGHVTAAGVKLTADIISKLVMMYHINAVDLIDIPADLVEYNAKLMEYAKQLPHLDLFEYTV